VRSEGREKKRAGERGRSKRKGIMLQGRVKRGGQRERGRRQKENRDGILERDF
jgi:hypothetical protein